MKVMTILGTRPEIIRLSRIIPLLDRYHDHILVNTFQNYKGNLNEMFFQSLGLRKADYELDTKSDTVMNQVAKILVGIEQIITKEKPDKILILGDTNSALSAIVAKKYGVQVYHMEAGNRCYDERVPEEINRRIVDHCADIHMPYTERSRQNLLSEGIAPAKIFVTGNPIKEVIEHYRPQIESSNILATLGLKKEKYFLCTLHRSENVDNEESLAVLFESLIQISEEHGMPTVVSVHPRTRSALEKFHKNYEDHLKLIEPVDFFDFVQLEINAKIILTDSGTVQEECSILSRPSLILRNTTERPEAMESGSGILTGVNRESIVQGARCVIESNTEWTPPAEYLRKDVSATVFNLISSRL